MMVAAFHSFIILRASGPEVSVQSVLLFLFNGRAAVTLFFVLSGYVLGLSLRRADSGSFARTCWNFVGRRLFRIYPAFLFVTLLILVSLSTLHAWPFRPSTSDWYRLQFSLHPTARDILRNLAFLDYSLNDPAWTLRIEMQCSLLLPLLHLLSRHLRPMGKSLLLIALTLLPGAFRELGGAKLYVFMFYLGYLLPDYAVMVVPRLAPRKALSAAAVLLAMVLWIGSGVFRLPILARYAFEASGAALLILCIGNNLLESAHRCLMHPVARYLGRTSYSFYLVHLLCLYVSAHFLLQWTELDTRTNSILVASVLWLGSAIVASILSGGIYVAVEHPALQWSKRLFPQRRLADASLAPSKP
jgi:peptidoglycan/LPS O-acetylase OafA/YrhL